MTSNLPSKLYLPLLWCTCLSLMVILCHESQAQSVFRSRDNHTGVSHFRSSWDAPWPGIVNGDITDAETIVNGYLIHGLSPAPSNLSFSGAAASLVVEDTLRVHGDLRISDGAGIYIKPGGVLIVHGIYEQDGNVTFNNEGQAIFLSDWTAKVNSGSFSNTGNLYIAGRVRQAGLVTNHKPYADLINENPTSYYFSRINVIRAACEGVNTGTLTFDGNHANVIHWESSQDFFLSDITQIAHTEGTYAYENLVKTTSFRVYLQGTPNYYSGGAGIVVLETAKGGSVSGPAEALCSASNSGVLSLDDFLGGVVRWEMSTDGFETVSSSVATADETFSFTHLSTTTSFRAVVKNGQCEEVYSSHYTVQISPESQGGLIADAEVCEGENYGELSLSNHVGEVLYWESSLSSDFSAPVLIASTSTTHPYADLNETTYYRAVVKSGVCAEAYSAVATVTVSELSGGVLAGSQTVCEEDNEGMLTLENHQGNILRWEVSADNFREDIRQLDHAADQLAFQGLTETTYYRVVVGNEICEEEYSTIAKVEIDPAVAGGTITASENFVCAESNSGSLSLQNYAGDILRWERSSDGFATDIITIAHSDVVLPFEGLSQTTSYRAVISSGSCGEAYSSAATITVDQPAERGSLIGGNATFCAGENEGVLQLENYSGEIIRWERSADGFENDIELIDHTTASLTFTDLTITTSYRVLLQNGSCSHVYSSIATISIDQPAVAGSLLGGGPEVCTGDNEGTLTLEDYSGEIVRWESSVDNFTGDIQTISHSGSSYAYAGLTATTGYRAVLRNGSCAEVYTNAATIVVIPQSEGGQLAGSTEVCAGENYGELSLSNHVGEVVRWESSLSSDFSAPALIASTSTTLPFDDLKETTYYRAVIKSGMCAEAYSAVATVTVSELNGGVLAGSQTVCEGDNEGTLILENHQGNILRWERSADGFLNHVEPIAHTGSSYTYAGLITTYSYRVVIGAAACGEAYSGVATIAVEPAAAGGAITGGKRIIPADNRGELRAEGQQGNILRWEKSTDNFTNDIQPIDHTESILIYENLEQDSWYRVLVSFGNSCSPVYSSTAALLINRAPLVQDDHFLLSAEQAEEGYRSEKSLLDNDMDPDGDPLLITSGQDFMTTAGNSLSIDENGYMYYVAAAGFAGTDSLQYRVCDIAGEASRCSYGYVILEINEMPVVPEGKVVIYQGVSPNGDGLNDKWVIDNIEQYPKNLLQIFDRSGLLVYEVKGYDNTIKVFEGIRNKGFGTGSSELPESTYFYRLKLDDSQPLLRGYVILNR